MGSGFKHVQKYACATVSRTSRNGVLMSKITGLIGRTDAAAIWTDQQRSVELCGAHAQIIDVSEAVLAIDQSMMISSLNAMIDRAARGTLVPASILAREEQADTFSRYCMVAASRGVGRQRFTEWESAHAWALQQAVVFASWPAARCPSAAGSPSTADSLLPSPPASARA